MQIIVNTCLRFNEGIVMIQKPRRGWWYLPGGKVDAGETWLEAAVREVREETGLIVGNVTLAGIYLVRTQTSPGVFEDVRTIVQFATEDISGEMNVHSREGKLEVVSLQQLEKLPMNEGDRWMVKNTLATGFESQVVHFGKFSYTAAEELLDWAIHPGI
ncbi:NUDIX domain-containing protein [Alicyclobacillus sp. SO9]|uniref:NUDIX domain-containing protein n=1 Tax=Alicyclobacillus sp. SO9 TaxID=2665646 RepID=UPI0018E6EEE3|nr:NUDIX domain-containing protein [Alicyclobacillus sp. SO9]QQE79466.1 NUDIX domain-containing protein [Alicyclobacillus sp. SO9]